MRIYGNGGLLRKVICCLAFASCAWSSVEVQADSWGGSWGGRSGGSWGGSGGYGSGGGLFGGRRPIRNLLGRIGGHFNGGSYGSGGGGSWGGGSTGYGSNGSIGHSYASGGGYGSVGYSSVGSSYGSVGSSYGSVGSGYGSGGSSYGSVGSGYGSVGSSYGSVGSSYGSVPSYGSVGSGYVSTGIVGSVGMSYDAIPATSFGYSAPVYSAPMSSGGVIYDSGYAPSQPPVYDSTMPSMTPESNGLQPVPGIYYEGGKGSPTPANPPSEAPSNNTDFSSPPSPNSESDGSTSIVPDRATVLSLRVPVDAQVYINDHKTKTKGDVRRYVSRNLESGREYYYHVKAIVFRDGKKIERNELVSLKAGQAEAVEFDFEKSVTSLALKVPANARVTLCGKTTNAQGDSRHFSTTKLEPGQVWNDYTIEVAFESNGKVVRQEKKINMIGGESYQLTFEFDATKELLAVR